MRWVRFLSVLSDEAPDLVLASNEKAQQVKTDLAIVLEMLEVQAHKKSSQQLIQRSNTKPRPTIST